MKPTFLLVTCTNKKNIEVAHEIKKNYGIDEAVPVFGTYDCIVKTEKISHDEVRQLIASSIRPLNDVSAILPLYTDVQDFSQK
jgi:cytidylate kinase